MSLSSGAAQPPSGPLCAALAGFEASAGGCSTVLMSVKVSVCHSGIRPLCLPGTENESLRLQLSMDPGKAGEFRLTLRHSSGTNASIAEFDLRAVQYRLKTPQSHELSMTTPPYERITFNFHSEQEAQAWATVVMSSLREAHRVATGSAADEGQSPPQPLAAQSSASLSSAEELCTELVRAIKVGDVLTASVCAESLAHQRMALHIQPSHKHYTHTEISLSVVVEDSSSSCSVTVKVFPHTTVAELKQRVFVLYGFHPHAQCWVIGQSLCSDSRSLASYGIQRDGDSAFLYLLSRLNRQNQENASILADSSSASSQTEAVSNGTASHWRPYSTLPTRRHPNHSNPGSNSLPGAERLGVAEIQDLINMEIPHLKEGLGSNRSEQPGWACPSCTYINKPTRPGCEMCSTDRPQGYTVPGGYRPDTLELRRIQQEKEAIRQYQQEKGRREELRANNSLLYNLDQDY